MAAVLRAAPVLPASPGPGWPGGGAGAEPRAEPPSEPLPEALVGAGAESPQVPLPLASSGVQRWVWQGRYGAILIEVMGAEVFVNGERVAPHEG